MSTGQSAKRLRVELKRLMDDPVEMVVAAPLESNILDWRFVIKGASDGPYAGGVFMGRLKFPPEYPWKPPSVYMCTPSGRFQIGTRICLSISDFHPETWVPSWTVATILVGVISFFHGTESTVGSMDTTQEAKVRYAAESRAFNEKDKVFKELFGEDGLCSAAFAAADATIAAKRAKSSGSAAAAPAPAPAQAVFEWADVATSLEKVSGSGSGSGS